MENPLLNGKTIRAVKLAALLVAIHAVLVCVLLWILQIWISPLVDDFLGNGTGSHLQTGLLVTDQSYAVVRGYVLARDHLVFFLLLVLSAAAVDAVLGYLICRLGWRFGIALWFALVVFLIAASGCVAYWILYVEQPVIGMT
jgi:hypothetical protein